MSKTEAAILERLIDPETPEQARYILHLAIPPADRERMAQLDARAGAGTVTPAEQAELDAYRHVNEMLTRLRGKAERALAGQALPGNGEASAPPIEIPPGIRRSQEALRRDLPKLLENKKLLGQWVAYHGDECIGIARTEYQLIKECIRRGLNDDEYYVGWIDPTELIEEEEVTHGLCEFDESEESERLPTL